MVYRHTKGYAMIDPENHDFAFSRSKDFAAVPKTVSWMKSKKVSNDQELIQSDPTSCPQNQKRK